MFTCTFTHKNVKYKVITDSDKTVQSVFVNNEEIDSNNEFYDRAKKLFANKLTYGARLS